MFDGDASSAGLQGSPATHPRVMGTPPSEDEITELAKGITLRRASVPSPRPKLRMTQPPDSRFNAFLKVFDLRKVNKLLVPVRESKGRWFVFRVRFTIVKTRLRDWWRARKRPSQPG